MYEMMIIIIIIIIINEEPWYLLLWWYPHHRIYILHLEDVDFIHTNTIIMITIGKVRKCQKEE